MSASSPTPTTTPILDPSQAAAVEAMLTRNLLVVTGPPGSGKTTTVRTALAALPPGAEVLLAAPTGKAARRLAQATDRPATTIHRMLGYRGPGAWAYTRENPIRADLVVIDESSMLDYELALAVLYACRLTRLVLVGDADQLPPIGLGAFFRDLIASGVAPVARLATQHRAAAGSWVVRNAPRVLAGEALELTADTWHECDSAAEVTERVVGLTAAAPAQVIAPMHSGACGITELNARLAGSRMIEVGHRVIQTRNNYDLDVMNGEIGEVVELGADGAAAVRWLDLDRSTHHSPREARDLEHAYALTAHRVQGSEYDRVLVVVHSSHVHMLDRTILYTAITRAKQGCVLVGDAKGLRYALKSMGSPRLTGLAARLSEAIA